MLLGLKRAGLGLVRHSAILILSISTAHVALALDPTKHISQYQHTAWRMQDGVFPGVPHAIAQTTDGYIWIGTLNGLLRFDGVKFEPLSIANGEPLRSPVVSALTSDRDGSLWIGTNSDLERWQGGQLTHFPQTPGLFGRVQGVIRASDGSVWVAKDRDQTKGPICELQGNDFRCYGPNDGVTPPVGEGLLEDKDGSLWFVDDRSLFHWDPKQHRSLAGGLVNVGVEENFQSITFGPDGSLWMGLVDNSIGLARSQGGRLEVFNADGIDGRAMSVSEVYFDSKGSMWIGTERKGLYRVRGSQVDHYTSGDGLSSDDVDMIMEDREGNIWVTTSGGLDRFRDVRVSTYTSREGLSGDLVNAALAASDGSMWLSNRGSLDILHPDGRVTSLRGEKELPGRTVWSLMEDQQKRIWVGMDNGLQIFDGRAFIKVPMPGTEATTLIFSMTQDQHGDVWAIAGSGRRGSGRLLHFIGDTLKEQIDSEQLPVAFTHAIAADPHDGIWVPLTEDRVAHWSQGRAETFALHRPPQSNAGISGIVVRPDGSAIVSTHFHGLSIIRNGEVRPLSVEQGLPCARIWAMAAGEALWLYGECGVVELSFNDLDRWWKTPTVPPMAKVLDNLDGAQPSQHAAFPGASVSPNGHVWFANTAALQEVDPKALDSAVALVPVQIERVLVDGKTYENQGEITLPPLTRDIEIDYTSPTFAVPQRVHFRYRLDGARDNWIDSGTRRQALFSNLNPGSYRFRVSAASEKTDWTPESTVTFRIRPKYYQTTLFTCLCILATFFILLFVYRLRVGSVTRALRSRLQARMDERERIARDLHDTLFQDIQGLLLAVDNSSNMLNEGHPTRNALKDVLIRSDQVMADSRQRVLELRAENLDSQSIGSALTILGNELATQSSVEFHVVEMGSPQRLHPVVFQEVLRIGSEALLNAFHHSAGKRVEVEIIFARDNFSVRIVDDGKGIDDRVLTEGGRPGHFGLKGMTERAKKIGGRLTIRSRANAGTEIEISIPMNVACASLGTREDRRLAQ